MNKIEGINQSTTYDEGSGFPASGFGVENAAAFEVDASPDGVD